jgi:hypothetical protein
MAQIKPATARIILSEREIVTKLPTKTLPNSHPAMDADNPDDTAK